jgi:hypothetical protein
MLPSGSKWKSSDFKSNLQNKRGRSPRSPGFLRLLQNRGETALRAWLGKIAKFENMVNVVNVPFFL